MTELEQAIDRGDFSNETRRVYMGYVRQYQRFVGGRKNTPKLASDWIQELRSRGLQANTINVHISALKYASRTLGEWYDDDKADFARKLKQLKRREIKRQTRTALSRKKLARLLSTVTPPRNPRELRDRALILVAVHTGFRRTGLHRLAFDGVGRVRKDGSRRLTTIEKGPKEARASVGPEAAEALMEWMGWLRKSGIRRGPVFRALHHRIDGYRIADDLKPGGIAQIVVKRGRQARLKVSPHALRHTFASLAIEAGVPLAQIQRQLGHSSARLTELYAEDVAEVPLASRLPTLS